MDAYSGLLGLIRSGELTDSKVSESSLADRLGMSRTPVREALRVLDAQSLVISRGRGVRVRVPGARELTEAFETRCALEGYAAQRAAEVQRAGLLLPARLLDVEGLAERCDEVTRTQGPSAGAAANRSFHLATAALAGNQQINALLVVVWDQIAIASRAGLTAQPRMSAVHDEHHGILRAIRDGNPERARAAATRHIDQTQRLAERGHEPAEDLR